MSKPSQPQQPPAFPPSRVLYEAFPCDIIFDSEEELAQWKAEPWWRRFFGLTERDRRIARSTSQAPSRSWPPAP